MEWEYKVVPISTDSKAFDPLERQLNYYGIGEGWELIAIHDGQLVFKKERTTYGAMGG